MSIKSLDNDRVKKYTKLQKKKYRDIYSQYIVEGEHLVREALAGGVLEEVILVEGIDFDISVPIVYVSKEVMSKISQMNTPSVILGVCNMKKDNLIVGNKILILDDIQDPGNLGTIIRSATAFNIDTIILSENTVDLYNYKVLRATQGMIYHINIIKREVFEAINELKEKKIVVYGTDVKNGVKADTLTKEEKEKCALVVGNEGKGVRKEVAHLCDKNLYIEMNKKVESLNVAVATSILLYELNK